jgi:hypothetical protein
VIAAILVQFLVRGKTGAAVPYYGIGVFMPIMAMGLAIRQHIRQNSTGKKRAWGSLGASLAAALAGFIFIGQIVGKWEEGGWVVLISLTMLILIAHAILISPAGYRDPRQINRIIREKSRVQGAMGSIAEWQSLKTQEYRYNLRSRLLITVARFAELFGVHRPLRFEPRPVPAGDFDQALHADHPEAPSLLAQYLDNQPPEEPRLGGKPSETGKPEE